MHFPYKSFMSVIMPVEKFQKLVNVGVHFFQTLELQDQKVKFSTEQSFLDLPKPIWTCMKQFQLVQNNLDRSKKYFGPIEQDKSCTLTWMPTLNSNLKLTPIESRC